MASIEDRITEILRTHFWIEHLEGCACGEGHYRWDYGESHYIAHVARVLVTELGLTEETGFRYTHSANGNSHILMNLDVEAARRMASRSHSLTEVARYVTPWQFLTGPNQ